MEFNNNALKFHKNLDCVARHYNLFYVLIWHLHSHTHIVLAKVFSFIISSDKSMANFLISKNVLENNKKKPNVETRMNLYIR